LNFRKGRPIPSTTEDSGLSLSGAALTDLLQAVVSRGSLFTLQAKGFSMSPFIRDGDVVTLSPLHETSPGIGDVVAFIHPAIKRIFIHRVIRKKGDSYIIKGDNSLEGDGPILVNKILGLVTRVDRGDKRILLGLGPERFLIALLARKNLFLPLFHPARRIINLFSRHRHSSADSAITFSPNKFPPAPE
jgi:signal peptidase I